MSIASIQTASSSHTDPNLAVADIAHQIAHNDLALVLFFCSSEYPQQDLAAALAKYYPHTPVVGCTSAGELSPDGYHHHSITLIAFNDHNFTCASALVTDMANLTLASGQQLIDDLVHQIDQSCVAPVNENTFALTLLDGLSIQEEAFLKVLNASLGNIPLLGGSAGDDLHFKNTQVFYQGQFHSSAALILLINTRHQFHCFSQHHLLPMEDKLVVTHADAKRRRVYELNGLPASTEYARVCGIPESQLHNLNFAIYPLVVKVGQNIYARSVQKVHSDHSLSFYSAIEIGVVLTTAKTQDIVQQTQSWLAELQRNYGQPQLVLAFDCIFRLLEIDHQQWQPAMASILNQYQVAGFSTYGEQYQGSHLNHTLTGVYLGPVR